MKPGETLNPNGRPVGSLNLSTKFKKFLEQEEDYEVEVNGNKIKKKFTREEILMFRLYKIALNGDVTKSGETSGVSVAAIKEIHDRTHGKPPQELKVETESRTKVKLMDGEEIDW